MNIAVGTPVERGKNTGEFDSYSFLMKLVAERFNGYACVTIAGKTGFEEGVLLFHDGIIAASDFEYYRYNVRFAGDRGLERCYNAFLARNGVLDLFALTTYQVQLVLTLNEDAILSQPVDGSKRVIELPSAFSSAYEDALAAQQAAVGEQETREQLLKRLGLSKLSEPRLSKAGLVKGASREADELKHLLEE